MSNNELLNRYAEIKIQISKYENELEMIKGQVLAEVKNIRGETDSPIELKTFPGYKFSIMKRKTWSYSDDVAGTAQLLAERKKQEEADGTASFTETEHLTFKSPKE